MDIHPKITWRPQMESTVVMSKARMRQTQIHAAINCRREIKTGRRKRHLLWIRGWTEIILAWHDLLVNVPGMWSSIDGPWNHGQALSIILQPSTRSESGWKLIRAN